MTPTQADAVRSYLEQKGYEGKALDAAVVRVVAQVNAPPDYTDDLRTVKAMSLCGGGFIKALSQAWIAADPDNRARIKTTWPEYWAKYSAMAQPKPQGDTK